MKYAVISDIHGNNMALQNVIDDAVSNGADAFIPASNEPSAALARAFGECREGQYPAPWGASNFMPRCLRRGY